MILYSFFKKVIVLILPKKLLFRFENSLRYIYYWFYIGNQFQCNICGSKNKTFINLINERICPRCGSLQRTRRLWKILSNEFLINNPKILDFSPSRSIYRVLKKGNYDYLSSDLSGNFLSDVSYDITKIDSVDNNFDVIICYHILEHIDNDLQAMKEMHRVLKKGGCCIIQTPFKDGDIYEDVSKITPAEREIYFGQSDHVRIYSVAGLKNRLKSVGLEVEVREYNETYNNINGFKEIESVFICHKK